MIFNLTSPPREEQDAHEKKWGGYNEFPPKFTEITHAEFSRSGFFTWCITHVEHRQIIGKPKPDTKLFSKHKYEGYLQVIMFYMNNGSHFAICNDPWKKIYRIFKFADCFHTYRELSVEESQKLGIHHFGMCYHVCQCTQCGHIWEYDSSD